MRSKSQILSKLRADGHITDEEYKALEQEPCEDAISRQAVIDGINEYFHDEYYQRTSIQDCRDCLIEDVIKNLPPVTPQPKTWWIPVSERLPEEGIDVLVWYRYWRYGEYNNWYYTYGIGYQFDDYWSVIDGGIKTTVYAWQELPEPYDPQERSE